MVVVEMRRGLAGNARWGHGLREPNCRRLRRRVIGYALKRTVLGWWGWWPLIMVMIMVLMTDNSGSVFVVFTHGDDRWLWWRWWWLLIVVVLMTNNNGSVFVIFTHDLDWWDELGSLDLAKEKTQKSMKFSLLEEAREQEAVL